jgi:glycosyltransferase involved in cell wall biosynthesis
MTRDMPLAVNCRFLEREMRGIGRYALGLASGLASDDRVVTLTSRRVAPHLEAAAHALGVRRIGPLTGPIWEQTTLPAWLYAHGSPALLNLVNTAPLAYGRQAAVIYDLSYVRHPASYTFQFLCLYRALIPRVARHARVIITLSEYTRQEIIAMFRVPSDRVRVVHGFVADEILRLAARAADEKRDNYALTVSSLHARKNLRATIEAFRRACVPGLRLRIVGDVGDVFRGADLSDLNGDDVELIGSVTDEELVRLYKRARVLLYPSLYEGFGLPPLEAMACGCPVVASRVASLPEVCGDAAAYCDPLEIDSIAAAIRTVCESPEGWSQFAHRARARAGKFTLDNSLKQLREALRAIDS